MKKKLVVILILFLSFLFPEMVNATTHFHNGEYIDKLYVKKIKADGTGRFQQALFLRRDDGQFAYCIEPWEEIDAGTSYNEGVDVHSLDDATLEQISLIAYYGYQYKDSKYDHRDDKWYYFTQILIWREIDKSSEFYFTDTLNGNKITTYDDQLNEILTLVKKNKKTPDFQVTTVNLGYGDGSDLIDINYVLSYYEITHSPTNATATIDGNMLRIRNTQIGKSTITMQRKDTKYSTAPLLYRHDVKQDFLVVGSFKPQEITINLNVVGGEIILKKVDQDTHQGTPQGDASLLGSIFEIYDSKNQLVHQVTLTDSTEVSITGLKMGKYKIKEIEVGTGYLKNEQEITVDLNKLNTQKEVIFENKVIENEITIQKYYGATHKGFREEEGITFEIYNQKGEKVKEVTTNQEGKATFSLPYGTYNVKQKNSKYNYEKVEDFTITVSENGKTQTFTKYNYEKFGKIIINKVDQDTKARIQNNKAVFRLINKDTKETIGTYETYNDGSITIDQLSYGTYELQEIEAPTGYVLNTKSYTFEIGNENRTITYDFENKIIENKITLIKYYGTPHKGFKKEEGITFEIYNQKGEKVKEVTTNQNGEVTFTLAYGTYTVKQKNGKYNYEKVEDFTITVSEDGKIQNFTKYNYEKLGKITIYKVDLDTKNIIQNNKARFYLINKDTMEELGIYETDESGHLIIDKLSYGTYELKEVEAPTGYVLNTTPYVFEINDDNRDITYHFENKIIENVITITKYYGASHKGFYKEAGITFQIFNVNGKLVKEVTTDYNGEATFILPYGTYTVKQKNSKYNYYKVEDFTIVVEENGKQQFFTKYNYEKLGRLTLEKIDSDTKEKIKNNKTTFVLINHVTKKELGIYETDNDGNLVIDKLSYGTYELYEMTAPTGYVLQKEPLLFTIQDGSQNLSFTFENKKIENKITIHKYYGNAIKGYLDEVGITFEIYDSNGSLVIEVTTDQQGIATFYLKYGTYLVKQKTTKPNYEKVEDFLIKVEKDKEEQVFEKYNQEKLGSLILYKIDKETKNLIKANPATFLLINLDTKEEIGTYQTDKEGLLKIESLSYGHYKLIEIEAPYGYILNTKEITFTIDDEHRIVEFSVENEKQIEVVVEVPNTGIIEEEHVQKRNTTFDSRSFNYEYEFYDRKKRKQCY